MIKTFHATYSHFKDAIRTFWKDEEGATAAEYGIIAALIAVAIIGAVQLLGGNLQKMFTTVADNISK